MSVYNITVHDNVIRLFCLFLALEYKLPEGWRLSVAVFPAPTVVLARSE